MAKLSDAQRNALKLLYDENDIANTVLSIRTLESLEAKGFVEWDDNDEPFLTSFGRNVVKMMRGEIGPRRRSRVRR